jgi:hypothetical protein
MSAFPDTDTRYGEVLAARQVPREQWRNYHKWGRFYLHFCHKYRHRPADSKSLQLFIRKLASKGQTAEPLINKPFCHDNVILAGFSGGFAPCYYHSTPNAMTETFPPSGGIRVIYQRLQAII